jgi:NAD(P)-dependent dehydrogenase (short-subunit alcohol dehydrogenase family)
LADAKLKITTAAQDAGKVLPQLLMIEMEVLDMGSVSNAVKTVEENFPKLDILINNAGYLGSFVSILDSDPESYWLNYEINVRGVYLMTKAVLPFMLRSGEKTILNVSSLGAHGIFPGGSGYETSKFAILRFTEYIMVEYGEQGLLAYSAHPCSYATALTSGLPDHMHHSKWKELLYPNRVADVRPGLSDDVEIASDTMCFLTQTRRDWLAGRYISCNWDMPELLSREKEIVDGDKLKMRMVV